MKGFQSSRVMQLLTGLLLVLPPLFWAGNFIIGRAIKDDIGPFTLTFARWFLALLILLPFTLKTLKKHWPIYWQYRVTIVLTAITGIAMFNVLVYTGLKATPATNGMIMNSIIPLLIPLIGAVFFSYALSSQQIIGAIVSMMGVLVIVSRGDIAVLQQLAFARGDIQIFSAMIAWAFYTIWLNKLPPSINRVALLTLQISCGLVILLPLMLHEVSTTHAAFPPQSTWLAIAYLGIFPSLLAYLCYGASVKQLGPNIAGFSIHLLPIFGAILSVLLLGEKFALFHLLGMCLIFSGIAIAMMKFALFKAKKRAK
jgi:drug/metabolite transporter (DMT)-like permease